MRSSTPPLFAFVVGLILLFDFIAAFPLQDTNGVRHDSPALAELGAQQQGQAAEEFKEFKDFMQK